MYKPIAEQYNIGDVDNRDTNTTWLWLDGTATPSYVEVDPVELFLNMLENADPEEADKIMEHVEFARTNR